MGHGFALAVEWVWMGSMFSVPVLCWVSFYTPPLCLGGFEGPGRSERSFPPSMPSSDCDSVCSTVSRQSPRLPAPVLAENAVHCGHLKGHRCFISANGSLRRARAQPSLCTSR